MKTAIPTIEPTTLNSAQIQALQDQIRSLARERNAVVLAHNYQRPEVQDVADYTGDSLGLARTAAATEADVIVFCGVHFMAETAKILSPKKKVLLPNMGAGCSLADTITADELRGWKKQFPGYVTVGYVNTSAAVKAELDYCCTSGNVLDVIDAIPEDKSILFLPDMFLGAHIRRMRPHRNVEVWMGECHVHAGIDVDNLQIARDENPEAEVLVHPECGCASRLLYRISDGELPQDGIHIASTSGMIKLAKELPARTFIVATETGILHRMQKAAPEKRFVPADRAAQCAFMKLITLENLLDALRLDQHKIEIPEEILNRARGPIDRMVAIGG